MQLARRTFLVVSVVCAIVVGGLDILPAPAQQITANQGKTDAAGTTVWYEAQLLGVEGRGWSDTQAPFDRLPGRAEKSVRDAVWGLSRHSTGLCVRFVTDAASLQVRWTLTSSNLAMPHMPATGVSGVDLYMRSLTDKKWKWVSVGQPRQFPTNTAKLAEGLPDGEKEFLLYFPLYNGVTSVEIGLPPNSQLSKAPPYPSNHQRPIVFYGTSITQGGCASRPGMVHTAILQRRLECPVINLGFSGNGRMEPEVGALMTELDAAVYVIDCNPNLEASGVRDRTEPLVRALRARHPLTPILLVEDRTYADAWIVAQRQQRNADNQQALWEVYQRLLSAGVGGLHYLPGSRLLGSDGEGTVDGSHPTDLGFERHANAFEPALRAILRAPQPAADRKPIEGYASQVSVAAGETISFHISSSVESVSLEISRLGKERTVVRQLADISATLQPIAATASSHGCDWPATLTMTVPTDWQSGYYVGRLAGRLPDGKEAQGELWFIVRSSQPGKNSRILLQLSTNTYNAYSNWGGYSLYAYNGRDGVQGRRVSFNRPVTSQFSQWELPFVQWCEAAGYPLDFASNSDLEFHPEMLAQYRLILSVGHDEYWSSPMRDQLEKFVSGGGNVAFLSGNTCCWQVRSEEHGRALTCWKQEARQDPFFERGDLRLLSTLWSHHLVQRPENQLTGVGFLWGGYHRSHGQFMDGPGAFQVHAPDHWLFANTGLPRGAAFGGQDTIVGYECDGCEWSMMDGVPVPTFRDGTPPSFQILATCVARWHPDDSEWYERWEKGRTGSAVLGMYTRGGTVITAGSTDWSHGLRGKDPAVEQITRNVLDRLRQ